MLTEINLGNGKDNTMRISVYKGLDQSQYKFTLLSPKDAG
jgi:hypothetical protein